MKKQEQKNRNHQQGKSLNTGRNLLIMLITIFCGIASAQDNITLRSGSELQVKVIEVTDTELRYKDFNNLTGPVRVIAKTDVFMVKYQNGVKEIYTSKPDGSTYVDNVKAQKPAVSDTDSFVPKRNHKFGGPRFGLTAITPGTISDELADRGKNPVITQFGWQFETRLFSIENGPSGIVEFIPLIGGMEQGLFLPSANLLIGLRGSGESPFEFALGPNLSVAGLGMVFAAGTNFRTGSVNFPVNIAFVPSVSSKRTSYDPMTGVASSKTVQTGYRITLTVGFNMRKK